MSLVTSKAMNDDSGFEQWVTDQGGPEAVVAMVVDVQRQVAEGLLPGFSDKEEFVAHLGRRDRWSA